MMVFLFIPFVVWLVWWIVVVGQIRDIRTNNATAKTLWVLIVTLFPFLGLILWHWVGKSIVSDGFIK
ncbi:PLDc N-terminal domain-containing protein [Leucobacter exalbidus]|nr:PLDc N-terminal domain-containing protein [Leucobacter exalbidus]